MFFSAYCLILSKKCQIYPHILLYNIVLCIHISKYRDTFFLIIHRCYYVFNVHSNFFYCCILICITYIKKFNLLVSTATGSLAASSNSFCNFACFFLWKNDYSNLTRKFLKTCKGLI